MKTFKEKLTSIFPLAGDLGTYDRRDFRGDLAAGITTAVLLIPQAMAYAMIAGLPPRTGLYASLVPLALYALLGTSRQLSVGPVAIISLLVASAPGALRADPAEFAAYAALLALLAGAILVALGTLRFGFVDNFLSHPVVTGYTAAAALIIAVSQLKNLTGLPLMDHHLVFMTIADAAGHLGGLHGATVAVGLISIAVIWLLKQISPSTPGALIVLLAWALLAIPESSPVHDIALVGEIPAGLPGFQLPRLEAREVFTLLPLAATIALLAFIESVSVARMLAARSRRAVDADRELVALGLANIGGSLTGGYPVTGGFSRTAVNYDAGARTGVASLITAAFVMITLLYLTHYLAFIPRAALAAVIVVAVAGLIDIKAIRSVFKVKRNDGYVLLATFAITLLSGVEQGLIAGVLISLALHLWQSVKPHMAVLGRVQGNDGVDLYRNIGRYPTEPMPHFIIVRPDAPLFFANVKYLEHRMLSLLAEEREARFIIIDGSGINDIDSSALDSLRAFADNIREQGCGLYMASLKGPVRDIMQSAKFYEFLGEDHCFETVHGAVMALENLPRPDNPRHPEPAP
ncbi:MAG: sulfate permease [Candidatus Eremiobacteraeota bacterium]|nr:sulfate permease [Candidatus Eremiobacteraeota bacterium]